MNFLNPNRCFKNSCSKQILAGLFYLKDLGKLETLFKSKVKYDAKKLFGVKCVQNTAGDTFYILQQK